MKKIPSNKFLDIYKDNNYIDSPLVPITEETGIIVDMQYPKLGLKEAINECLVRKEVLDKLLIAKNYLPKNYTLKIWDAYRPLELQNRLYNMYKNKIIEFFDIKNLSIIEQDKIISNYVSLPNEDENIPPLHTTGGSIDLTIVNTKTNKELDLGISFDEFSNITNSDSYEKKGMDKRIRNNRRMLYNAMIKAGFTNLPSEIWHYDYGNRAWAYYMNKPAIYKGIFKL